MQKVDFYNASLSDKHPLYTKSQKLQREADLKILFDIAETFFGFTAGKFFERNRSPVMSHPRFMVILYAVVCKKYSLHEVGRVLCFSHKSVLHALNTISEFLQLYDDYRDRYIDMKQHFEQYEK